MKSFRNSKAVSNVIGFMLMLMLLSTATVLVLLSTNAMINSRTSDAAEIIAQDIANSIADSIMGAVTTKRTLENTVFNTTVVVPQTLAGRSYYVEVTDSEVFVNSTDGSVSKNCTNYKAEEFGYDFRGKVSGSTGKIQISGTRSDYVYKFDFGTVDSDVELEYRRVTQSTAIDYHNPGWFNNYWGFRMPIVINNIVYDEYLREEVGIFPQNLTDFQLVINLYPTNFDYSKCAENGSDIVFVASTEFEVNSILPYWIEYWNPIGTSKIWVKLTGDPFIETGDSRTIYMYYGYIGPTKDPSIEYSKAMNNPSNVFEFYDDFKSLTNWTQYPYDDDSKISLVDDPKDKSGGQSGEKPEGMEEPTKGDDDDDTVDKLVKLKDDSIIVAKNYIMSPKPATLYKNDEFPGDHFISYTMYNTEALVLMNDSKNEGAKAELAVLSEINASKDTNDLKYHFGAPSGFKEGTLVDGVGGFPIPTKPIEEIKFGDDIRSLNAVPGSDPSIFTDPPTPLPIKVTDVYVYSNLDIINFLNANPSYITSYIKFTLANGQTITCTPNQQFYCHYCEDFCGGSPCPGSITCPCDEPIGITKGWLTAQYIYNKRTNDDFCASIYTGTGSYSAVIRNTIGTEAISGHTYHLSTSEKTYDDENISMGPNPYPSGSYFANGAITKAAMTFPTYEVYQNSYILSSSRQKQGPYLPQGSGFTLTKAKEPPASDDILGVGANFLGENRSALLRVGTFLGKSYAILTEGGVDRFDFSEYVILGASRFNATADGDPSKLNSVIYNVTSMGDTYSVNSLQNKSTSIYDTEFDIDDSIVDEKASGDPYRAGLIGLSCNSIAVPSFAEMYVDWVRVYQTLMYDLDVVYDGYKNEESLNYGWVTPGTSLYSKTYESNNFNNSILKDCNFGTTAKIFKISNLESSDYTLTITIGSMTNAHNTKITVYDENNPSFFSKTNATDIGKFETTTTRFDYVATDTNELYIKFENDGSSDSWAVCAITLDKGQNKIELGDYSE